MKKMRLHIYIALAVALIGFILGSFFDLNLSSTIFSRDNPFGLGVSIVGTIPGYGMFAVLGGASLFYAMKKSFKTIFRVLFYIFAAAAPFLGVYFAGREFFGVNGFVVFSSDKVGLLVGCLIALPIMGGLFYFGYRLFKSSNKDHLWLLIILLGIALFMALIPGVTMLKAIFHRPRFRAIEFFEANFAGESPKVFFHHWWERCTNYGELIKTYSYLGKDEFKSFPSGHVGAATCFMLVVSFLPLLNKEYEKKALICYYAGFAWALLVAASRILVGAHFLSDVSMGMLLSLICLFIVNEVIIHIKYLHEEEVEAVTETPQVEEEQN